MQHLRVLWIKCQLSCKSRLTWPINMLSKLLQRHPKLQPSKVRMRNLKKQTILPKLRSQMTLKYKCFSKTRLPWRHTLKNWSNLPNRSSANMSQTLRHTSLYRCSCWLSTCVKTVLVLAYTHNTSKKQEHRLLRVDLCPKTNWTASQTKTFNSKRVYWSILSVMVSRFTKRANSWSYYSSFST